MVDDLVADVLAGLDPGTPLERRAALNIAKLHLRLERLDRLEGNLIEGASSFTAAERTALGDEDRHWQDFLLTQDIEMAVGDPDSGGNDDLDYYAMTAFLQEQSHGDKDLVSSHGTWHPGPGRPGSVDDKQLFDEIVNHFLARWRLGVMAETDQAPSDGEAPRPARPPTHYTKRCGRSIRPAA